MSHHAHKVNAFTLPMEDRVGALLKVAEDLLSHGVNLTALWAWTGEEGTAEVVFVPEDPALVAGCGCETCCAAQAINVLWVELEDRPGLLRENLAKIAAEGINIRAVQGVVVSGRGALIFTFADEATLDAAASALEKCCA